MAKVVLCVMLNLRADIRLSQRQRASRHLRLYCCAQTHPRELRSGFVGVGRYRG